eukprot:c18325_g1_i1.p1 GENE.c18325_g1_i1~~c18325_g1_i1.p1  ORF type:complete len:106 (-),score=37.79 c18325_g1_i1:5-322(-)
MVQTVETLAEFNELISKSEKPVIVDYGALWCGPCQRIKPVFHRLSETTPGMVFVRVDADNNEDIAELAEIKHMPTFIIFKQGQPVERVEGPTNEELEALVAKYKV